MGKKILIGLLIAGASLAGALANGLAEFGKDKRTEMMVDEKIKDALAEYDQSKENEA